MEQMTEPLLGFMKTPPPVERNIDLFQIENNNDNNNQKKEEYAENIIVSSRYTPWNFLPKSLFEQFRRLANVYFLIIGIIAIIGSESNYYETAVEPAGILGPMIVVVLISVIKDGIEDIKRHNQDAKVNARITHKINKENNLIYDTTWRDLSVGDLIILYGDEEIPADVVVLACGGVQGSVCYVETAAIDGETNLKMKNPCLVTGLKNANEASSTAITTTSSQKGLRLSKDQKSIEDMNIYRGTSICAEVPNGSIHRFNGFLQLSPEASADVKASAGISSSSGSGNSTPTTPTNLNNNTTTNTTNSNTNSVSNKKSPVLPIVGAEQRTLTEKNLLLRGSVLRATEWCICVVTYTGADTKLSLNSKKTPSKLSSVDRIVNRTLVVAISVMILVCLISMVFSIIWENEDSNASYLCLNESDLDDRYTNGGGCENSSTSSILTIFTFATLYNNFVCISMYVSLELVYLCQAYFLSNDLKLYDSTTDTPAECHTSGMCADLGQVQYVLSDKTGTLTKNLMVVQHFSVGERVFGDAIVIQGGDGEAAVSSTGEIPPLPTTSAKSPNRSSVSYTKGRTSSATTAGGSHTTTTGTTGTATNRSTIGSANPLHSDGGSEQGDSSRNTSTASTTPSVARISSCTIDSTQASSDKMSSLGLFQQMPKVTRTNTEDNIQTETWLRRQYIRMLVYCNTAMLMPDSTGVVSITDLASLKSSLNAESPDEVALITAAAQHCGALLVKRDGNSIEAKGIERYQYNPTYARNVFDTTTSGSGSSTADANNNTTTVAAITTPVDGSAASYTGPTERVELLAVNEFDSNRKMMSVLLRVTDTAGPCGGSGSGGSGKDDQVAKSRIMLICKGADSSVLKNCHRTGTPYTQYCMTHIENFANVGLRTLAAAVRLLSENEAEAWLASYKAAGNSIQQRKELLSQCAKEIEKDMYLLGAIGIEDELQDGVPDAIETLHEAGINVWMITGDKAETGLAIGKKCNLINLQKQELERIVNLSDEALRLRVNSLHTYVFTRKNKETAMKRAEERMKESAWYSQLKAYLNIEPLPLTPAQTAAAATTPHTTTSRDSENDGTPKPELALLLDGISLEGIWASEELKIKFVECIQNIPTVIACRVSPLQKSALVRMIKASPNAPVTLAIGDGANDVGMIHESRVGVGISGKEGRHAANSADFAISQFSFIITLMFHHGRYNYIRCSKLVLYSFFKNLVLVSILFYYCTYSGFSGTMPLDSIVFSGYNFYLGLPILAISIFDCDISIDDIMKYPYLAYNTGRNSEMLNMKTMSKWCFFAFLQGLLLFVLVIRFIGGPSFITSSSGAFEFDIYGTGLNTINDGRSLGIYVEGFLIYTVIIVSMQYKVVAMAVTPNDYFWFLWVLSFCGFLLFVYLYGLFPTLDWFNTVPLALAQPLFWLAVILVPLALSVSDYCVEAYWAYSDPSSRDILVELLLEEERMRGREKDRSSCTNGVVMRTLSEHSSPSMH